MRCSVDARRRRKAHGHRLQSDRFRVSARDIRLRCESEKSAVGSAEKSGVRRAYDCGARGTPQNAVETDRYAKIAAHCSAEAGRRRRLRPDVSVERDQTADGAARERASDPRGAYDAAVGVLETD